VSFVADAVAGAITAADPAYTDDVGSDYVISFQAKNGMWHASIKQIGTRVAAITARHGDFPDADPTVPVAGTVGVDTASAGFFDAKSKLGIISSSGYGDGAYQCFVARDRGAAIAARIVFIGD
jgi:hypothetical protein